MVSHSTNQYKSCLNKKNEDMKEVHKHSTVRIASDVLEFQTIPPVRLAIIDKSFWCIVDALWEKDDYKAINLHQLTTVSGGTGLKTYNYLSKL